MQLDLSGGGFWLSGDPCAPSEARHFSGWVLSGGFSQPFVTRTARPMNILSVLFKPLANVLLTDYRAFELHNQHVPLSSLWGKAATQLAEDLVNMTQGGTRHVEQAVQHLQKHLLQRLPTDLPASLHHLQHILEEDTLHSSQELRERLQCSAPTLVKRYRQHIGLPPRHYLRVQRLKKALELLASEKLTSVEVALSCGYADQAHFNHEFKHILGFTPGAYRPQHPEHPLNLPFHFLQDAADFVIP